MAGVAAAKILAQHPAAVVLALQNGVVLPDTFDFTNDQVFSSLSSSVSSPLSSSASSLWQSWLSAPNSSSLSHLLYGRMVVGVTYTASRILRSNDGIWRVLARPHTLQLQPRSQELVISSAEELQHPLPLCTYLFPYHALMPSISSSIESTELVNSNLISPREMHQLARTLHDHSLQCRVITEGVEGLSWRYRKHFTSK